MYPCISPKRYMCNVSTGHAQGPSQCSVKQAPSHNPLTMPIKGGAHAALSSVLEYQAIIQQRKYCTNMDFI